MEIFENQNLASIEDGLGRLIVHEKKYDPKEISKDVAKFSSKRFEKEWQAMVEEKLQKKEY